MITPLVTIITPTHNRPAMFSECAAAVLDQTFTDWVWWVVFNCESYPWDYLRKADNATIKAVWQDPRVNSLWFPVDGRYRYRFHVPAQIVNWIYPKVTTPYIYFLADDDLIDTDGLGTLVGAMNPKPDYAAGSTRDDYWAEAVYGRCEVIDQQPDGSFAHACWCYEAGDVGLGTGIDPHCRLDGGQVLHTKTLWDQATADGWQLTDSKDDAAGNDGTLLNRLAEFARFHYVPTKIVTHRRHSGAAHHRPQEVK